jgi:hypothetical protein
MAPVSGDDQSILKAPCGQSVGALRGGSHQGSNASTLAAQMKSLIEMPPTECVLNRTVQLP